MRSFSKIFFLLSFVIFFIATPVAIAVAGTDAFSNMRDTGIRSVLFPKNRSFNENFSTRFDSLPIYARVNKERSRTAELSSAALSQLNAYPSEHLFRSDQTAGLFSGFRSLIRIAVDTVVTGLFTPLLTTIGLITVYSPFVDVKISGNDGPITVLGNAYATEATIHWSVTDSASCEGSVSGAGIANFDWWTGIGTLNDSFDGSGDILVDIDARAPSTGLFDSIVYTLACVTKGVGDTKNDSITINPSWSPSISLSGPASVTASQTVYLTYSARDIKTCTRSWTGGTLSLSGGNTQGGTLDAGFISADTTFTLTCNGFNNTSYRSSWTVDFIGSPTPFFFINSINLILVGPGSGGTSNKATIGITPGGGFSGTIDLSAANSALTSAGAQLKISPTTITCPSAPGATTCTTAEFWVETVGDIAEAVYDIVLTADPRPSGFEDKTQTIPLRVRKFVPAFEEI